MPKTALHRLAENLLARQADDKALQLARHSVLDTAGCILAGSDSVQVMRLQAALESAGSGSAASALRNGTAARTGVEAALLAQAVFTGVANAGEGETGFFQLYGTPASPGWDCLLEASLPRINDYPPFLKPSPSCGYTLRAIEVAELLHARQEYSHLAINKVTVDIAEPYFAVAGIDRPREPCEARFSLVYCVASALIDGKVDIASFTPEMLYRSQISDVSKKTSVRTYALAAGLGDMSPQAPDTVTVHMKDGTQLAKTVARVRGGPGRLLCRDDVVEKYVSCGGRTKMALEFLQADPCDLFTGRISR